MTDIAMPRPRQCDEALRSRLVKPLLGDLRATSVLIGAVSARQQVAQAQVACPALTQQQQTVGFVPVLLVGHPHIAADDRLEAVAARSLIELHQPEHVGQIGQRQRRHPVLHCTCHGFIQTDDAIRDGVLAMQPQMDELERHAAILRRVRALLIGPANAPTGAALAAARLESRTGRGVSARPGVYCRAMIVLPRSSHRLLIRLFRLRELANRVSAPRRSSP